MVIKPLVVRFQDEKTSKLVIEHLNNKTEWKLPCVRVNENLYLSGSLASLPLTEVFPLLNRLLEGVKYGYFEIHTQHPQEIQK